jgi:hypothetical protein
VKSNCKFVPNFSKPVAPKSTVKITSPILLNKSSTGLRVILIKRVVESKVYGFEMKVDIANNSLTCENDDETVCDYSDCSPLFGTYKVSEDTFTILKRGRQQLLSFGF